MGTSNLFSEQNAERITKSTINIFKEHCTIIISSIVQQNDEGINNAQETNSFFEKYM